MTNTELTTEARQDYQKAGAATMMEAGHFVSTQQEWTNDDSQSTIFNPLQTQNISMASHTFVSFPPRNKRPALHTYQAKPTPNQALKRQRPGDISALTSSMPKSSQREKQNVHDWIAGSTSCKKRRPRVPQSHRSGVELPRLRASSTPLTALIVLLISLTTNAQNPSPVSKHYQSKGSPVDEDVSLKEWVSLSPFQTKNSLDRVVPEYENSESVDRTLNDHVTLQSNPHPYLFRKLQTEQQCTVSMGVRDSNRDDLLSQNEFVEFLNQLFGSQYQNTPFLSLPCALQEIFEEYADSGTSSINVAGTKPGQSPTAEQAERLSAFCEQIISTVDSDPDPGPCVGDSTGGAPVSSPVAVGDVDCSGTISRAQCNTALAIADLDRNGGMDSSEYVRFVNRLSTNAYQNVEFSELPGNIQNVFQKLATDDVINLTGILSSQTASAAQNALLDSLCCETDLAVANPGEPLAAPTTPPSDSGSGGGDTQDCSGTVAQVQCNTALTIADSTRDNALDETEYVRFVNRLSNNAYIGVDYSALPATLQSNFEKFAVTNGQIDVNGSKPGQTPTAAQSEFLADLCCETDLAIDNADTGSTPTEPAPSPPTASAPPTYEPLVCRTAMASSDFNRDDNLNEDEYVRFLNRLTQNQYLGVAFTSLSTSLQDNFNENAVDGLINIFGTKPGQTPTTTQSEFLDAFCVDTAMAIQSDGGGPQPTVGPGGAPTVAPVGTPTAAPQDGGGEATQPPTFPDSFCRTAMASSDFNRDDYLNHEEYVRFLNRLTSNQFPNATFQTLETSMQEIYDQSVDDTGEIWVFGSKPGEDGTEEQEAFILNICMEISIALDQSTTSQPPASAPSTSPPSPPSPSAGPASPPAPTLPPGIAEVYNSFITSNTRGLTSASLQTGVDREGLDNAYGSFAEKSLDSVSQTQRRLHQLRGRRLAVSFVEGTDEIYYLTDSDCPNGLTPDETCQTVFAKFQVKIDDENPQQISEEYSASTQQSISDGQLQEVLTEVDPRNSLRIVNASYPISITLPPTPAPVATEPPVKPPAPTGGGGGEEDGDKKGGSVGAIVGGIFGAIALCAFIGWASSKCKGAEGSDMKDDDDASDGEKENGFGGDKDDSGKGSNDFGFGDKPEQNPGDTKNVFGFGKKNKQGSDKDLNTFGADGGNDNAFGDDNDNLELFAFDEPSVVKGGGDGQEGSVAEKDNTFGGESGWGNTANAAGGFFGNDGGWGAPGGDAGGADNFFGASTFGETKAKESGSGSKSGSEEGSYTSSEDSTYESGNVDEGEGEDEEEEGEESGSYSRSSADEGSSYQSGSKSGRDDADWDGIAEGANSFEGNGSSLESSSKRSSGKDKSLTDSDVDEEEGSYSGSESGSGSASGSESGTTETTRTEEREKRAEYRAQVDALVRLVLPDEVEKIDAMMEQFKGREAELVSTLQTMQERSATQRARAAVHKSKSRPQRGEDGVFALSSGIAGGAEGSAAGTAAIAAASLPIPAAGAFDEGGAFGDDGFGNEDAFGAPEAQEAYDDEEEEGSYYDDEDEGSQSHSGSGSRSGSQSYYSGEEEGGSFTEGSRSRGSQSGSQSYYSEEGSRSRYSGEDGSQVTGSRASKSGASREEGSRSHTGSRSRSQYSGEEGSRSHTGSRSRSQYSGEEGSRSHTGSRSRSQYSGEEGSGSGSRSQYSGEEEGSRSQYSGEEEGSRSYYSGEEGSQGSRSYDSREEGSQSQGSRSYYSGEEGEEGSYYSGEGDEEGSFSDEGEK